MREKYRFIIVLFILIAAAGVMTSCGSSSDSGEATALTIAGFTPENDTVVGSRQIITVLFSRGTTQDVKIGGALAAEWNGQLTWQKTNVTRDTLELRPATTWIEGTNRTLEISGGELGSAVTVTYTVDATVPSYTVNPVNNARISPSRSIIVTFTDPVDYTSLLLGGSMKPEADSSSGSLWGNPAQYSILTIKPLPLTLWTEIPNTSRSLSINCNDIVGNRVPSIYLNYIVDSSPPEYSVDPDPDIQPIISLVQPIVVKFEEPVDYSSLVIDGEMGVLPGGEGKSEITPDNKWVTISPKDKWTPGYNRQLIITGNDSAGNSINQIVLCYIPNEGQPTVKKVTTTDPVRTLYNPDAIPPVDLQSIIIKQTTNIIFEFSEPMDTASLSISPPFNSYSQASWDATEKIATISPKVGMKWPEGTSYTLTVTCKDKAQWTTNPKSYTVHTDGEQPQYGLNPDIAKSPAGTIVSPNAKIHIEFSETMDTASRVVTIFDPEGEVDTNTANYNFNWSNGTRGYLDGILTIEPKTSWLLSGKTGGSCVLYVTVKDRAGNATTPPGTNYDSTPLPGTICIILFFDLVDPYVASISTAYQEIDGKRWINGKQAITITFDNPVRHGTYWGEGLEPGQPGYWNGYAAYDYTGTGDSRAKEFLPDRQTGKDPANFFAYQSVKQTWTGDTQVKLEPADGMSWSDSGGVEKKLRLYVMDVARRESVIDIPTPYDGGKWASYVVDEFPPTILSLSPETDQDGIVTEIPRRQAFVVRFSEPVNTSLLDIDDGELKGTAAWKDGNTACVITGTWTKNPDQYLKISNIQDKFGNINSTPLSRKYHVRPLPVASVTPASGSTIDDEQDIFIKYRKSMNTGTLCVKNSPTGSCIDAGPTYTVEWAGYVFSNDTVKIRPPTAGWGSSKTMYVYCNEAVSGALVSLYTAHDVQPGLNAFNTISAPSGSIIDDRTTGTPENIILKFDEDLDKSSMNISGSITAVGVTDDSLNADELSLRPTSGNWSVGDGETLVISGLKKGTTTLPDIRMSFTVLAGVVYADNDASDIDPGTAGYPKASIQEAIDLAAAVYSVDGAEVHVKEGSYSKSSGPVVVLKEGISVLGGYSQGAWGTRSVTVYPSVLSGATSGSLCAVEAGDASMQTDTVLDGFYVYAANVSGTKAVYLHDGASPTVQNCYIYGIDVNSGSSGITSYGMYISESAPYLSGNYVNYDKNRGIDDSSSSYGVYITDPPHNSTLHIEKNVIIGGTQDSNADGNRDESTYYYGVNIYLTQNRTYTFRINNNKICGAYYSDSDSNQNDSYGLRIYNASSSSTIYAYIYNNLIHGGDTYDGHLSTSKAIYLYKASPYIQNNTMYSTGDNGTYGIYMDGGSHPYIQNNIIYVDDFSGDNGYCIGEETPSDYPQEIKNNILHSGLGFGDYIYFDDGGLTVDKISAGEISSVDIDTGIGTGKLASWNNYSFNPVIPKTDFYDGDFLKTTSDDAGTHLQIGGLKGNIEGWNWNGVYTDYYGNDRTATVPWSIGAQERN